MARFIPKKKLSKKAQKELAAEKRRTWAFSPVTKKIDSKKHYSRKKKFRAENEDGADQTISKPLGCIEGDIFR